MGIDIIDVGWFDAGALHRGNHAAIGAVPVGGCGDVEGIAGQSVSDDFRIDFRAARLGMLELFEHHHAGPLAHDETVAVAIVRTRSFLRLVIEIRGERAAGGEPGNRQPAHRSN